MNQSVQHSFIIRENQLWTCCLTKLVLAMKSSSVIIFFCHPSFSMSSEHITLEAKVSPVHDSPAEFDFSIFHLELNYLEKVRDV